MTSRYSNQLVLNLGPRLDARLSDFAGSNWTAVIAAIDDLLHGSSKNCFVYGEPNTGKTHLLAAVCEAYSQQGYTTLLLSLRDLLDSESPDLLESLENFTLIALDDVEVINGHEDWQQALFNLLSRAKISQTRILLAARTSPADLGLQLLSLNSQLSKAVFFHIPNGLLLKHLAYLEEAAVQQRKKLTLSFVKQLTEPLLS